MIKTIKKIMTYSVITGLILETFPVWALTKDESIYAKLNSDGQVNKVIVSEHLEQTSEEETMDKTKLENIQNVNGNEKYTLDNGKLVWESNGKDIYYQGTTKEELPITLNIKYFLNDEEKTIQEILGKKGKVKIVLKYSNNDNHYVNINGKYENIFTPFVIATTTIIPNTTNKNINVTNGKVITNGTNSVIAALSTPGLYESLKIDKLKGMDTIETTFDTESFELSSIYSVATPKLIDNEDLEIFDNIDKLYSSINTLSNSSNQLKTGSNKLLQGANQINDGIIQLKNGIEALYNGSNQIQQILTNSIQTLQNDNSQAIDQDTLNYIVNNAEQKAIAEVNSTFTDEYKNLIAQAALEELAKQDDYKTLKNNINALKPLYEICQAEEISEQYVQTCEAKKQEISSYPTLVTMANSLEKVTKETAIKTAYQTALQTAKETAAKTSKEVAGQIANKAKNDAKEKTTSSLKELLGGISQITNGLNEVNTKMNLLINGTEELKNGISQLDSGIAQFNSQGINKIVNIINGDVKSIETRIKELVKLSNNYKTFDESTNETNGSTKIIMVVDGIKNRNEIVINNYKMVEDKKSLWDKIKNLFI